MIISIASGKGGTGKTTVATNLAVSIGSDLHLLTDPEIKERHDFQGGSIAVINPDKCTECGLCRDLCRFDAVSEAFKDGKLSFADEANVEGHW
jgi:MinD superfamily P-loop ATPase